MYFFPASPAPCFLKKTQIGCHRYNLSQGNKIPYLWVRTHKIPSSGEVEVTKQIDDFNTLEINAQEVQKVEISFP